MATFRILVDNSWKPSAGISTCITMQCKAKEKTCLFLSVTVSMNDGTQKEQKSYEANKWSEESFESKENVFIFIIF